MKNKLFIITFIALIIGCKETIIVPDSNNSLLPEYSEQGRDVSGALINDTAWMCIGTPGFASIYWQWYINSFINGDSTIFKFQGQTTRDSKKFVENSNSNKFIDLFAVVKGLKIESNDSLSKLINKTYSLDGINSYSGISSHWSNNIEKGNGSLTINRVQKIEGPAEVENGPKTYSYILSGRFNFKINESNIYEIKDGRFDLTFLPKVNLILNQ